MSIRSRLQHLERGVLGTRGIPSPTDAEKRRVWDTFWRVLARALHRIGDDFDTMPVDPRAIARVRKAERSMWGCAGERAGPPPEQLTDAADEADRAYLVAFADRFDALPDPPPEGVHRLLIGAGGELPAAAYEEREPSYEYEAVTGVIAWVYRHVPGGNPPDWVWDAEADASDITPLREEWR